MKDDVKEIKKRVNEDWLKAFPELSLFAQNRLYKIFGPLIIGLELIKLPRAEEYRQHFVCYPLWKKNVEECLDSPIMLMEFKNKKGLQFSIPYIKHNIYFVEVIEFAKKQMPISFNHNVSLKEVLAVFDEYSKKPPLSAAPNSYLQARLAEAKLLVTLYVGDSEQIQRVMTEIEKKNWDSNHFKSWKTDYDKWISNLREKVDHRDELLNQIALNKRDKKIAKLQQSELKA